MTPSVSCIGALNIDRTIRCVNNLCMGESNAATVTETIGGVMHNVALTIQQLECEVSFAALVGTDQNASIAQNQLPEEGLNRRFLVQVPNTKTGTYTLILDKAGEVVLGLADMEIYETVEVKQVLQLVAPLTANTWIIDSNFQGAALEALVKAAKDRCLMAVAVSSAKAPRLRPVLGYLNTLFLNQAELMSLMPEAKTVDVAIDAVMKMGTKRVFVTQGSKGVVSADQDGVSHCRSIKTRAYDLNGVGDAFSGAAIASLVQGESTTDAMTRGVAAASLVAEVDGATRIDLTKELINRRRSSST